MSPLHDTSPILKAYFCWGCGLACISERASYTHSCIAACRVTHARVVSSKLPVREISWFFGLEVGAWGS